MNRHAIADAARLAGFELDAATKITITGADPVFDSTFRLGEGAAVAIALGGQAANRLWVLKGGRPQQLTVDVDHAAASLISFSLLSLEDEPGIPYQPPLMTAMFPCRNGRLIHLHASFDDGRGALDLLDLPHDACQDVIARATSSRDAFELEESLAARKLCGAVVRSAAEWAASPQGRWLSNRPVVEILRIGDSPPEPLPAGPRPLSGIRVLDLTRVLAGPACARTLAEHGADVLHIASPNLPTFERFEMDTGHGKRQAHLDINDVQQAQLLLQLIGECDVFSQGFRLGALARRGYSANRLAQIRPGLVYVSENCYGNGGPWGERPGWEQLAQAATGIAVTQGGDQPNLIPAAFNDYTTGYLAAMGTMEALRRRACEGGSWHVRVSLCQTAMWFQRLGNAPDRGAARGLTKIQALMQRRITSHGSMSFLPPSLGMSETPPHWSLATAPLGSGTPTWLPRS